MFTKENIYSFKNVHALPHRGAAPGMLPQEPSREPSLTMARARFRARDSLSISTLVVSMSSS